MNDSKLVRLAIESSNIAYAPYSNFTVGAALLCNSGKIYTGCNIENASFSMTICAERVAFSKAISEGERSFSKIAIFGRNNKDDTDYCPPCGACRQFISEFSDKDFEIILVKNCDDYKTFTLYELLPSDFSSEYLKA